LHNLQKEGSHIPDKSILYATISQKVKLGQWARGVAEVLELLSIKCGQRERENKKERERDRERENSTNIGQLYQGVEW
jgi:hypothetical protein